MNRAVVLFFYFLFYWCPSCFMIFLIEFTTNSIYYSLAYSFTCTIRWWQINRRKIKFDFMPSITRLFYVIFTQIFFKTMDVKTATKQFLEMSIMFLLRFQLFVTKIKVSSENYSMKSLEICQRGSMGVNACSQYLWTICHQ